MGSWFFMSSSSTLCNCRRLGKPFHGPCNLMSQSGEGGLLERGVYLKKIDFQSVGSLEGGGGKGKQRKEGKEYKSREVVTWFPFLVI